MIPVLLPCSASRFTRGEWSPRALATEAQRSNGAEMGPMALYRSCLGSQICPLTCGNSAPGGTRTPDPRIRRRKARVQPVLSRAAWCWSVRLGERFIPNVVRPVGFCVVLFWRRPFAECLQGGPRRAPDAEPCSRLVWTSDASYTCQEMSTEPVQSGQGESLELPVEELLRRARPLPPHEKMLIDDLTEEEGVAFLAALEA